jgi:rod shape determining protein RodA
MLTVQEEYERLSLSRRLLETPWVFIAVLSLIAMLGINTLSSIRNEAGVSMLADKQLIRYLAGLALLILTALVRPSIWMRSAYPLYLLALGMLILVPFVGVSPQGAGARRWLALAGLSIQPSELLKIALVLALARYFHTLPAGRISHPLYLLAPLAMIAAPLIPIFMQPDLGTALLIALIGVSVIFLAGVSSVYFITALGAAAAALPLLWRNLHDYQRERVFTFLEPERDPLGAGYHLLQSKIAIGSAGLWGKGVMKGTQSQLNFLPEKHTDFIFAMFAEERGMAGSLLLMGLYILALVLLAMMAMRTRHIFGRLVISGMGITLFLYVFINMGMVMGLLPVVGVPLPLMSYGGTSILSIMFGLGVAASCFIHRREPL